MFLSPVTAALVFLAFYLDRVGAQALPTPKFQSVGDEAPTAQGQLGIYAR
jgi:hypothetical protein